MEGFEDKIMDLVWDQARDTAKEEFFGILIGDWDEDVNVLMGQLRTKMGSNADSLIYFLFAELIKDNKVVLKQEVHGNTDEDEELKHSFDSIPAFLYVEGVEIAVVNKNKEEGVLLYTDFVLKEAITC